MTAREITAKNRPDVTKLYGWLEHHRAHGKPFKDATIGEFYVWRCSCSETFKFKEIERQGDSETLFGDAAGRSEGRTEVELEVVNHMFGRTNSRHQLSCKY